MIMHMKRIKILAFSSVYFNLSEIGIQCGHGSLNSRAGSKDFSTVFDSLDTHSHIA